MHSPLVITEEDLVQDSLEGSVVLMGVWAVVAVRVDILEVGVILYL